MVDGEDGQKHARDLGLRAGSPYFCSKQVELQNVNIPKIHYGWVVNNTLWPRAVLIDVLLSGEEEKRGGV